MNATHSPIHKTNIQNRVQPKPISTQGPLHLSASLLHSLLFSSLLVCEPAPLPDGSPKLLLHAGIATLLLLAVAGAQNDGDPADAEPDSRLPLGAAVLCTPRGSGKYAAATVSLRLTSPPAGLCPCRLSCGAGCSLSALVMNDSSRPAEWGSRSSDRSTAGGKGSPSLLPNTWVASHVGVVTVRGS